MKHTLSKSIKVNGKDKKVININLDTLKGSHMVEAEREYLAVGGRPMAQLYLSFQYCLCLASKLVNINYYDLVEMAGMDAHEIVLEIQAFLLKISQPEKSEKSASTVEEQQKQE